MSKDRNTMAKRMREVEKKRKADEKRARRRKNKEKVPPTPGDQSPTDLSLETGD
jgi:hypothetical protein